MSRVICMSIVFLIAAAWLFTDSTLERRHSAAQSPSLNVATRWEYKLVKTELSDEQFNQLGEEGWEMVQVIPNAKFSQLQGSASNSTEFCAYFKRPK